MPLGVRRARVTRRRTMLSNFAIQFVQRVEDLLEDIVTAAA